MHVILFVILLYNDSYLILNDGHVLYRVSPQKRNARFSLIFLISPDEILSSEKNDIKTMYDLVR